MSAELLTDTCAVARPIGIRILSGASFLIAAYLFGSGILILLGAIPLASGRYFLGEYVNWGPALYFLVATGFAVLGVGLMRGWRSMRRLAIIAAALLVATSLLPISAAVTYFQIAPLVLHGVKIVLAIMAIRYLLQLPIRSIRMMPELAIMSSSAKPAQPATGAGADWPQYIEEFRRAAHESVDWIADYLSNTRDYPVVAPVNPGWFQCVTAGMTFSRKSLRMASNDSPRSGPDFGIASTSSPGVTGATTG